MMDNSSSDAESVFSSRIPTSAPSSPPSTSPNEKMSAKELFNARQEALLEQEELALRENQKKQKRASTAAAKRRKKKSYTEAERKMMALELERLLYKTQVFAGIVTSRNEVLGRIGSGVDGETHGKHELILAEQPKSMVGGRMHPYQLEGLRWMQEICLQSVSGILADEMGLGKTIQTISMMAYLREEKTYGPHLIVAPLSTLSNWLNEFTKWAPSLPVLMYHGDPETRRAHREKTLFPNLVERRPNDKFPIVCTSYEVILRDLSELSKIKWQFIIIDEGHRMKNFNAKLFQALQSFYSDSQTRFLITGTPLQNTLRELWSLLHFLLPKIFTDWEMFEAWFDFSDDLADEAGTRDLIEDEEKQSQVQKIHRILRPLLLRRVKADVAAYLPKKREYVLYAPMTKDQTDLYKAIQDPDIDTRAYLEKKVTELVTTPKNPPAAPAQAASKGTKVKTEAKPSVIKALPVRSSPRKTNPTPAVNAFERMMGNKGRGRASKAKQQSLPVEPVAKRKEPPTTEESESKSAKSSRQSTPSVSGRVTRKTQKSRPRYAEADDAEDDMLDDYEFEAKLAQEMVDLVSTPSSPALSADELQRQQKLTAAKAEIARKKLGNSLMQLRLVCNGPQHFYNLWDPDASVTSNESIVTSSGKMLLLDRLLPELFARGHKVLIFSQFKVQLDILEDYCELRQWEVCRIDGSVAQTDRAWQISEFNTKADKKIFLLSTRAGGQGINLAAADTVILFDSDWNPQQDLQAQDRSHRIGQTRPVIVYRLATRGTVEEQLLLNADAKRRLEKLVIQKGGFQSMGQKLDPKAELDKETLRSLLLKDGQVYELSGKDDILSQADLDVLCDRSDEAYMRAAEGSGNADGYQVVETGVDGITRTGV